jgi:hypothetical protein
MEGDIRGAPISQRLDADIDRSYMHTFCRRSEMFPAHSSREQRAFHIDSPLCGLGEAPTLTI